MTELRRLIETCDDPLERAILNAGCSVKASDATRERTLVLLCGERSTKSGVLAFLPHRKRRLLLVALSISTLAAAMPFGYYAWHEQHRARLVATPVDVGSTLVEPVKSGVIEPVKNELTTSSTSVVTTESAESASKTPAGDSNRRQLRSATEPNLLTAELSALDAARARLNSRDAVGALQLLDVYKREFPRPKLALEAEVLRIFAYDEAGQKALAKKRAETFVAKYPKGVLSARVRRYLEQ
jgi:hypothetical protein